MNAVFAVLADYALAHPTDGKFYIVGAGITSVNVSRFPSAPVSLALALRVEFPPEQCGYPHSLRIRALAPNGSALVTPPDVILSPAASVNNEPVTLGFVLNFPAIAFAMSGPHSFALIEGDTEIVRLGFTVNYVAPLADTLPAIDIQQLQRAFWSFQHGETEEAEQITRAFLKLYPRSAIGHNNLGFMVLARLDAEEALSEFARARAAGFDRMDLLTVNEACAEYLLGNAAKAFAQFRDCLSGQMFSAAAMLLGLNGDQPPFPQMLMSASQYASLVALNAGWSAIRAGNSEARVMCDLARSGNGADPLQGDAFRDSLDALAERCP